LKPKVYQSLQSVSYFQLATVGGAIRELAFRELCSYCCLFVHHGNGSAYATGLSVSVCLYVYL